MCRIVGYCKFSNKNLLSEKVFLQMCDVLAHGGPDDAGIFIENNLALGHRRLSIIDVSPAGHQPMFWKEQVIVFNGEIYNYKEIAKELTKLGYQFSSGSDTEVILKAFEYWGYEAVQRFRGMFAFAIWNKSIKKLLLCRDRVGIKPLYWYQKEDLFMFASELKAFHQHPDFDKTINQDAVSLYLQTGYIRSPYCIFKYAHKLEPGSFLEIDEIGTIKTWKYWDIGTLYANTTIRNENEKQLIHECENILNESFQLRMVADVPVGMFLSGGIDSSLVTALLQRQSPQPLKTFTIGFHQKELNEAVFAKQIAKHIGTDHTELYCTEAHFKEIVPQLPDFYDEPFGDSSGIPTYLVSKLAREQVTVSLSADAGDEIFIGYNKYKANIDYFNKINKVPLTIRKGIGTLLNSANPKTIENILSVVPGLSHIKHLEWRLPKLANALKAQNPIDFQYLASLYIIDQPLRKLHRHEPVPIFNNQLIPKKDALYSLFGVIDIQTYLEGDILTKVDRVTMQVALEGREPFLDHKIIEFALSLPDNMKMRNGETKWILRQILYKYVPKELIDRPKMGFGIPIKEWLEGILKADLLKIYDDKAFADCFQLDSLYLKEIIQSFLIGGRSQQSPYFVWFLYCLHQWYLKWIK